MKISISFECARPKASVNPIQTRRVYKDIVQNNDDRLDAISINSARQSKMLEEIFKRLCHLEKTQTKSE